VCANIKRGYPRTVNSEYDSQIRLNHGAVNRVVGFPGNATEAPDEMDRF